MLEDDEMMRVKMEKRKSHVSHSLSQHESLSSFTSAGFKNAVKMKDICIPVHGQILLHPVSVAIVDTPQFQRLRFIRQLSGAEFVYPGATHSRFEHSLGVAYLARLFLEKLQQKQSELQITNEELVCLEIAGLCHDLGHGPLSHTWENFMRVASEGKSSWKHEVASCKMLDYLIEANNLRTKFEEYRIDGYIDFIKDLIMGLKMKDANEEQRSRYFLYEIVNNEESGLDVDKWDYFLRDAHHLGIPTSFCYKRLMDHARVITTKDGFRQICFRDKTAHAIYTMFHTRSALHKSVYQHRVIGTICCMLQDVLLYGNNSITCGPDGNPLNFYKITEDFDMEHFSKLDEGLIYSIIRHSKDDNDRAVQARRILENVFRRRLYHCVLDKIISPEKVVEFANFGSSILKQEENIKLQICEKLLGLHSHEIAVKIVSINFGKGNTNPVERVCFFSKADAMKTFHLPKNEVSLILPDKFQEMRLRVLRRDYFSNVKDDEIRRVVCHSLLELET